MSGCGPELATTRPEPEPPDPPVPAPYLARLYVTGTVTNRAGQPVEGALVVVDVSADSHRTECDFTALVTGGITDSKGVYFNRWGEDGRLGRGCVRVFATKGDLLGRGSLSDVVLRSIEDPLPPDTVVVNVVLNEG